MACCTRNAVEATPSRCEFDYEHRVISESSPTNEYRDILDQDLVASGQMQNIVLRNPDSETGPVGANDSASQKIYIDVSKHIKEFRDIDQRQHQLGMTIVHEKIHMSDHQNSRSETTEDSVNDRA